MATQEINGSIQIFDESVGRDELNETSIGQAVIKKLIPGSGVVLDSTGIDEGTGDVTISVTVSGGGGGASTFLDLSDTPSSYTGHSNKAVLVKDTEDGLEFVTISGGGFPQVQADWEQSDSGEVDYIKNKLNVMVVDVMDTQIAGGGWTYDNGASGVGATLTKDTNGAGHALGKTLLVLGYSPFQTSQGVYIVTDAGSDTTPNVLTRHPLMDEPHEIDKSFVVCKIGTGVLPEFYAYTGAANPTIGTTNLTYFQERIYPDLMFVDPNVLSILKAANYAAIRTLLELVIGTNVQAWDADLDTLAGMTRSGNGTVLGTVAGSLTQNKQLAFDADGNIIASAFDAGGGTETIGYAPYAYPILFEPTLSYTSGIILDANGGMAQIPMEVSAPMNLRSVSIRNANGASPRSWSWALYKDEGNSATATRVAISDGSDAFTPSVASTRTLAVTSPPVALSPGIYWLVIKNMHASNAFNMGAVASNSSFSLNLTGALAAVGNVDALPSTLDLVTSWSKSALTIASALNGSVLGQSTAY
jgi:hypothetical protein